MNRNKLKAKCIEKDTTLVKMLDDSGISRQRFYNNLDKDGLTIKDIKAITKTLSLDSDEVRDIFFA